MDNSSLLKKALLGNAAFSTLCGLDMVVFAETLSRFLGFGQPALLRELGVSLLFFAGFLVVAATRRPINPRVAAFFTTLDIAWVVGTAALLIARPEVLNSTGKIAAVVVAAVVAELAALQILGIRRLTRSAAKSDDEVVLTPIRSTAS